MCCAWGGGGKEPRNDQVTLQHRKEPLTAYSIMPHKNVETSNRATPVLSPRSKSKKIIQAFLIGQPRPPYFLPPPHARLATPQVESMTSI